MTKMRPPHRSTTAVPPPDTKRRDTGDETFSVTSRAHNHCDEGWNCGSMDCPVPRKPRPPLRGVAGMVERAWDTFQGILHRDHGKRRPGRM